MTIELLKVTSPEDYASAVALESKAFASPYNAAWHTFTGPSLEEYVKRTWAQHLDGGQSSHWLAATDSDMQETLGAAHWVAHETNPFEKPAAAIEAPWWPEGSDLRRISNEIMARFFGERTKFMNRPHVVLENCWVSQAHRRRGVGRLLVKWGCDLADSLDLPCFVESSPAGRPLYESQGFIPFDRLYLNPETDHPTEAWLEAKQKLYPEPMTVWRMWRPRGGKLTQEDEKLMQEWTKELVLR